MKGLGYLVSIVSVFLLAAGAFKSASQEPILLFCLLAGMGLRYLSSRREQREKRA